MAHGYINVVTVATLCAIMMMEYLDGIMQDAGKAIDAQVVLLLKRKTELKSSKQLAKYTVSSF